MCSVPGLFNEVQNVVCSSGDLNPFVAEKLILRTRHLRTLLLRWHEQYDNVVLETVSKISSMGAELDKRYEVLGICLGGLVILERLTLALSAFVTAELEDET